LALLFAVALFAAALVYRSSQTPVALQPTAPATDAAPAILPTAPIDSTAAAPIAVVESIAVSDDGAYYREALIGTIQRLNPLFASLNPVDRDITSLIFEGLTRSNIYGEPVPALAESWIISSDGLEYIVSLRQDVLWQDGTPFSAADVIYTMALLRDPRFPGAPELGAFWRTVETEQLGATRIRFRLAQPLGAFLDRLTIGILPEHALRGTTAAGIAAHPFNLTPIGTGAYQMMRIVAPDGMQPRAVELASAPTFRQRAEAQATPYAVQRITFRLYDDFESARGALAAGEIDGLAARDRDERRPLFDLALTQGVMLYNTVEPTVGMIVYNWTRDSTAFFREQRVRLALETGLDRAGAIERALPNLALSADSPLIRGHWSYLESVALPTYDPGVARQMLITASERIDRLAGANAPTPDPALPAPTDSTMLFSFAILTPNTPSLNSLANEIATQWAGLGMDVRVEAVEIDLYEARLRAGDFDAVVVEFGFTGSGDPDVYSFWHEGQYPDGDNYGGVADRRISEILERARREPYNINRIAEYYRFQDEFIDRAIALPIYNPIYTYAVAPVVSGVQLGYLSTPASRFDSIGSWSITR
ncbi:MAG: ABC transporter substrate-binding protein, partial [Chloroflexota bacterium]|nr:ABC transporter substrate-binding protein [Chloroflexota bacterium]